MKNENSIDLPMEIWQKIFRFLDKKCRKNATLTCRKWFKIIRHDTIQSGMDLFISGQNTLKRSSTNYTPRLGFIHRLNWQCCLASSSKTAPRILIFFNCHGCQTFILAEIHNNSFLSGVVQLLRNTMDRSYFLFSL